MDWKLLSNDKVISSVADMPESLDEEPKKAYGFIYVIQYDDNTYYIGKKQLFSKVTLPALKSGEVRPNAIRTNRNIEGKRTPFDVLYKESKWQKYVGSSDNSKDKTIANKYILDFAYTPIELTYLECKYLFKYDAIRDEECLNDNILGKFYRGRV